MNKMARVFLVSGSLMIGASAGAQTVPPVPNVQTAEAPPAAAAAPVSSDPGGITQADSGSAIDKPAMVDAMPQTGYHAPVIGSGKPAEPLPHARLRAASQPGAASTPTVSNERPSSRPHRRTRTAKHRR